MDVFFKKRILTSIIMVPLLILLLLSPLPFIIVAVMLASIAGLYEYYEAVGLKEHKGLCFAGYIAAIIIPLAEFISIQAIQMLVYIFVLGLFVIMLACHKKVTLKHIGLIMMGLIYIPYFLSHIIYIRSMEFGIFYIWLVFIGACMTDTFAYFTGCSIGGKKLCPGISPKKTIAGAVGGVVGCGLSFLIFGLIVNYFFLGALDGNKMSLLLLFVLGLISAVISQIGDLTASVIQRQYGIKDFGSIFPGHGGILDRCDSIILVAPVIFLFLLKIGIMI